MTVRAIRLENFMAFKDTAWVELRPITLVFGRNSSGKSAIIRALRLLHQSLDRGTRTQPLAFVVEGGLDQGDFKSTINRRPKEADEDKERYTWKRIMSFAFRCRLTATRDILQARIRRAGRETDGAQDAASPEADLFDFKISFGWDEKDQRVKLVGVYILGPAFIDTPDAPVLLAMERDKENLSDESWNWLEPWYFWGALVENYEGNTSGSPFRNAFVELTSGWLPTLLGSDTARRGAAEGITDDFDLCSNVLDELVQIVRYFLESMRYLGPIRPEPRRSYSLDQGANLKFGRGLTQVLSGQVGHDEADRLNDWFEYLDLGVRILPESHITPLGGFAQVEVQERDEDGGETPEVAEDQRAFKFNLTDVGYGASQILPVIAEAVMAQPGTFVVVEQPELHLHPGAQVRLADLFIDTIYSTELKRDEHKKVYVERMYSGVIFFLETHSENLLLRMMRRISETYYHLQDLSVAPNRFVLPEDTNVLFVHRKRGYSTVSSIIIAADGERQNTPEGYKDFFADGFIETMERIQLPERPE